MNDLCADIGANQGTGRHQDGIHQFHCGIHLYFLLKNLCHGKVIPQGYFFQFSIKIRILNANPHKKSVYPHGVAIKTWNEQR